MGGRAARPGARRARLARLVARVGRLRAGSYVICSRATDTAGNVQPLAPAWNRKGYANNAVEHINVTVRPAPD